MRGEGRRENKAAELSWEVKGHTGSGAGNESRAGNRGQAQVQMGQQVDRQSVKSAVSVAGAESSQGGALGLASNNTVSGDKLTQGLVIQTMNLYLFLNLVCPLSSWVWFPRYDFNMFMYPHNFNSPQ